MYSKEIAEQIIEFLDKDGWNYKFDEENGIIKTGVNLEGKIKSCHIHIIVDNSYVLNYASIEIGIEEKNRIAISEFITRANYDLTWGNFEMDFNDGEIRFKMVLDCAGIVPTKEMIERLAVTPAVMFKRYGDGFLKVLFELSSPKDAVEECEAE